MIPTTTKSEKDTLAVAKDTAVHYYEEMVQYRQK